MLCIPMDHGISNGPIEGLEDPASTIYKCEGHGLTSVIINKGIIKALPKPPSRPSVVNVPITKPPKADAKMEEVPIWTDPMGTRQEPAR